MDTWAGKAIDDMDVSELRGVVREMGRLLSEQVNQQRNILEQWRLSIDAWRKRA